MLELFTEQQFIFGLMGGLGLFLFGMKTMSEGLQKVAGNRMRKILSALTANRFVACLVGLSVTAIIQSSSATTVMVVGFVNAGLLSLAQSIGIILGANIGTTVTAQLIAFKITKYALPAIGIGAGMKLFGPNKKWVYYGEVLLGFGILFFGLSVMKDSFDPLKNSQEFRHLFTLVEDNHLLGILIGALMTIIVQSSSATIGITLALASSGLITFEASVALILGENIGTTITANLAAIGTNLTARRTAFAHFCFNFLGVAYMLLFFSFFMHLIERITPGAADLVIATEEQARLLGGSIGDKPYVARHIANTHTLFNIVNTIIFLPMVGLLARLTTYLIRGKDEELEVHLKYIDNRFLSTPPIAFNQARSEVKRMALISQEMFHETINIIEHGVDEKRIAVLQKQESNVDLLQREISAFLVNLSQTSITEEMSREVSSLMNMVNDLERLSDHCEHLWKLAERKEEEHISFSDKADEEMKTICAKAEEFIAFIVNSIDEEDTAIVVSRAKVMEDGIDYLEEALRNNHIARLNRGECEVNSGLIYVDMLHSLEKIGDHSFNVARALAGRK